MSYDEKSLSKLLALSQGGDHESYNQFLREILPLITSLVTKKVFNQNEVSDVIQESLFSIHKALATYDPKRSAIPWVITITQRRIIEYIRKSSRKNETENLTVDGDVTFLKAQPKINIDTQAVLKDLPEETQKAITLTKIEGHSTKEAAQILGIKENALRTKISRGMSLLKKYAKEGVIDEK